MDYHIYSGSCLCGTVNFKLFGALESFYLCHCKWCRKDTGSAHASNLFAPNAKLLWLSGSSEVKTYMHGQTKHQKSFCRRCGSVLPTLQDDGKLVVVPAGCLDSKIDITPQAHLFYAYRAEWDESLDEIEKIPTLPK